jgi:hypothetical protein
MLRYNISHRKLATVPYSEPITTMNIPNHFPKTYVNIIIPFEEKMIIEHSECIFKVDIVTDLVKVRIVELEETPVAT